MSVPIPKFWQLLVESRLLNPTQCQQLGEEFGRVKGAATQGNSRVLAEWMIDQNVLSRYQSEILLHGHAGPFFYGDYKVYDRLERGLFAGCFKAVHAPTNHPVMLQFFTGDSSKWLQVTQQVQTHRQLSHPHLTGVYQVVDAQSFKFVVVEDPQAQSLEQVMVTTGRVSPDEGCRLARQVAMALSAMHNSLLVHDDVRPATILVEANGHVKLYRRPLSIPAPLDMSTPQALGQLAPRADYLAPELAHAGKLPDALTDIYGLGASLYHLIAGRPPFPGGDVSQKLGAHATQPIQPLDQLVGAPAELQQLVAYTMAKNPAVRYQQAAVLADQLAAFIDPGLQQSQSQIHLPTWAAFEQYLAQSGASVQAASVSVPSTSSGGGGAAVATAPEVKIDINVGAAPVSVNTNAPAGASKSPTPVTSASSPTTPAPGSAAARLQQQKKPLTKNMPLMVSAGAGGMLVLTFVVLLATGAFNSSPKPPEDPSDSGPVAQASGNSPAQVRPDEPVAVKPAKPKHYAPDDGRSLFRSPTEGAAVNLAYVPSGGQVFVVARPAALMQTTEGADIIRALGPNFDRMLNDWKSLAGVQLDEIEQVIVTLHENGDQAPQPSMVVRLAKPVDLRGRWGAEAVEDKEKQYFEIRRWARWIPPDQNEMLFVMGTSVAVKEVIEAKGQAPLMNSDIVRIFRSSDTDRHLTIVFPPTYFFSGGQKLFTGDYSKLLDPLNWFLGEGVKAAAVSMHVSNVFYGELRLHGRLEKSPSALNDEFGDRIQEVPSRIKSYAQQIDPPPYWRALWFNYPQMVTMMRDYTRYGVDGRDAVINFALPPTAASNLIAASELTIASKPGVRLASGNNGPKKQVPKDYAALLKVPIDLSFSQQSLEFAMRDLAKEVRDTNPGLPFPFDIKIVGPHLKLDGITRNQQVRDFDKSNASLSEVLTALCAKANPVQGAALNSDDQKLLWVIGPDPELTGKDLILITTRNMSKEKGYKLPPEFSP